MAGLQGDDSPTETEGTETSSDPLWTDDAIDSDADDHLDRTRFADMVAARINTCAPGQKSTVFGLLGSWGSGKTSLINLVRRRLEGDWKIAIFSPWASDTAAGLQIEFLAAVESLLEGDDEKSRRNKATWRKYGSVCAPLVKGIPYVGAGLAGAAEKALEATNLPWHQQFEEVSKMLESLGSRVLLIADDIDRLDADELLSFLKVVRLLGRFPNVHYLIAYDQTTVEGLLESKKLGTRSTAFMEKIVQYPFEVPPIAGVIRRRLLANTVIELIEAQDIRINTTHTDRLSEYISILGRELETPRAQARFKEQLLSFGAMLKDFKEVDFVDFVVISFIRVFYHRVYDEIPMWRSALQSGAEGKDPTLDDQEWVKRIRPLVDDDNDVALVKLILSGLFPGIRSGILYWNDHKLALSNNRYFDRYFLFGLAEDDVEDALIESALTYIVLDHLDHPDVVRYLEIIDGSNDQLVELAYEKSQSYRHGDVLGASKSVVLLLLDRMKSLTDEPLSWSSPQRVLWRWAEFEALNALVEGKLEVSDIVASLAPRDVLMLTARMLHDRRHRESQVHAALKPLGDHYFDRLNTDIVGILDDELDLSMVLSTVVTLKNDPGDRRGAPREDVRAIGQKLLDDDAPDILGRVIRAMVLEERWQGSDGLSPKLAFSSEALLHLFSNDATIRLAEAFPTALTESLIDKEDVSLDNRDSFARAKIRAIAESIPRGK
ncbi:KAP family P-loop NTPase fold protein [Mycolicibacterium cosmeticum]|uniref:KAP family P-loop NTPase fold protein n=1 Tax=Mycolicibacterium cosmeticum TaxID=258533 RepID=UPI00320473D0